MQDSGDIKDKPLGRFGRMALLIKRYFEKIFGAKVTELQIFWSIAAARSKNFGSRFWILVNFLEVRPRASPQAQSRRV